jgi:hypothetical protein
MVGEPSENLVPVGDDVTASLETDQFAVVLTLEVDDGDRHLGRAPCLVAFELGRERPSDDRGDGAVLLPGDLAQPLDRAHRDIRA